MTCARLVVLATLVLAATMARTGVRAGALNGALNDDAPVRIDAGLLQGVRGEDAAVRVFKGIPFAAPPTGERRWREPQPVASWSDVRKADAFGPSCSQPARSGVSALLPTAPRLTPPSEDCLYLNVWTAATTTDAKLPVMLYFPGGSFVTGGGAGLVFDGEALAKKGVVLVTTNYRLGPLGFFAHPELTRESGHQASGNYGLMDQMAAMQWVRKNIAAFGGDPLRVTIFGQSAGSTAVLFQVASPLAKGLFQRAIGESGGLRAGPMMRLAAAEQLGVTIGTQLGASTLADLRAAPAEALMKASSAGTGPTIDGWVLRDEPEVVIRHRQHANVPLMVGSNAEESNVLLRNPLPADKYIEQSKALYGQLSRVYLALYPGGSDEEAAKSQKLAFDDRYAWSMWKWADLQATSTADGAGARTGGAAAPPAPAFLYYFTRKPPADAPIAGAAHDAELYYVFHNLRLFKQSWTDWDRTLQDLMSWYWVNFARTGDPNGGALFKWPAYDPQHRDRVIMFGDSVKVGTSRLDKVKLAFWEDAHTQMLAGSPH